MSAGKDKPTKTETVNLYEFLAERIISKAEEQPATVDVRFADGTVRTFEIPPKHPWFKELNRRRTERVRASFKKAMSTGSGKTPKPPNEKRAG